VKQEPKSLISSKLVGYIEAKRFRRTHIYADHGPETPDKVRGNPPSRSAQTTGVIGEEKRVLQNEEKKRGSQSRKQIGRGKTGQRLKAKKWGSDGKIDWPGLPQGTDRKLEQP